MQKKNSLKSIYRRYHSNMKAMTKGLREREIYGSLVNGKNSYLRLDRLESSMFDRTWIDKIEGVIFDLGEIIANPKQNTKVEGHLVPVELARKTNAESVQHLASHTQYIKEIDEYGNVIPSKLLSMIADDDIRTYENRFIATFVRRLVLFIEKRYEFVSKFAELHDDHILYFKNHSVVEGATVEIETKIKVSHKSDDEMALKSNSYVQKIRELRDYILYFYSSSFMKQLKTEKDVHNPIIQTNIIRKNPLYHHCYEVYSFLEKYDSLGVNYKVDENYSIFTQDEIDELNHTLYANYLTLKGRDQSKVAKTNSRIYKPKILTSLDDESFIYGPLLSGPIEFARIDAQYQEYLDSKLKKDLPLHPTKKEKEYYAEEYEQRQENKQDLKQKNDFIKRKEKEARDFAKLASKIDEEREKARLELERQEKALIKQEENDMLDAARSAIIAASLKDQEEAKKAEEKAEKERLANIKPAVLPVEMSHPKQKPVTYDQAVLQIWPQLTNKPAKAKPAPKQEAPVVAPVVNEEPVKEEPVVVAPITEEQPQEAPVQPKVVPMSHPDQKPVTYDEATLEIWPQLKQKPQKAKKAEKKKEAPVVAAPIKEEQPQEEPKSEPVIGQVQPKVVPMSHPEQKPVSYDEATLEIWPQLANTPEPAKKAESEQAKKVSKPHKAKVVAPKEAEPVKEEAPVEPAPVEEAPLEAAPEVKEEKPEPKEENKPVKAQAPKAKAPVLKESKKPAKAAPKVEKKPAQKKEEPVKKVVAPEPIREKIPGKFILKTEHGYYIAKGKYSIYKEDAKIFDDFNIAKDLKKELGGKVVKL
ncbi:MAG: hypothetical protein J6X50_01140 [Bacilli bacterium]|nr:hypothetical protein [Bacilli bacterium]